MKYIYIIYNYLISRDIVSIGFFIGSIYNVNVSNYFITGFVDF